MKFTLLRFGGELVEFELDSVIDFPVGLPGFEECKRFKLLHEEGTSTVFWLQSLDDPAVLFSLGDPELLKLSYDVTLSDTEQALLEIAPGDELQLAVILFKEDAGHVPGVKANMLAPIILNVSKRRGLQKVLQEFDAQLAIKGA